MTRKNPVRPAREVHDEQRARDYEEGRKNGVYQGQRYMLWLIAAGGAVRIWQAYEHNLYVSEIVSAHRPMLNALRALSGDERAAELFASLIHPTDVL